MTRMLASFAFLVLIAPGAAWKSRTGPPGRATRGARPGGATGPYVRHGQVQGLVPTRPSHRPIPGLIVVHGRAPAYLPEGPPDLVVEIISPSTAARDRGIKRDRYRLHGVPEY